LKERNLFNVAVLQIRSKLASKKKIILVLIAFFGILLIFAARTVIFSCLSFSRGEEFYSEGRFLESAVEFKHSLRNYVPLLSKSSNAAEKLLKMSLDAVQKGDNENALRYLRMLRGGILSIRGLYQPFSGILDEANERIASLMASGNEQKRIEYLGQLRENHDPSIPFSLLSSICFILWIGLTIAGIFRGITREGKLMPKPLLFYGSGSFLFLGLWLFFLWLS
jgi:hypothetical protein